jgi:hypothetical protein
MKNKKWKIFSIILILSIFCIVTNSFHLYAEEFVSHTLKSFNLKFRFPYTWRWKKLNPQRNEGKVFEVFSPDKNIALYLWVDKSRSADNVKVFKSFLRKWDIEVEEIPDFSTEEYPNLQSLNTYIVKYKEIRNNKIYKGYFFTGTDGVWVYTFKLEVENQKFEDTKNTISEVLAGIDTNQDWQQICCAACLKEIRFSIRRTTLCSDFISENPCYLFFKNTKMHYEDCR